MRPVLSRHQWIVLVAVLIAVALLFVSRSSAAGPLDVSDSWPQLAQAQTWPPPPASPPSAAAPPAAQPPARAPTPSAAPAAKGKGADLRLPPITAQAPPASAGFSDAFGRFNLALPSGTEPLNATYNLAVPAAGLQINLSVAPRDEIFRNSLETFPDMMRKGGALNVGEQQFDYRGRPATMVVVRLRDPQGATVQSVNVFIPGANLWLQVNGPESNVRRVEETMQGLLDSLQPR